MRYTVVCLTHALCIKLWKPCMFSATILFIIYIIYVHNFVLGWKYTRVSWVCVCFYTICIDTSQCVHPTAVFPSATSSVSAGGGQSSTRPSSMVGTATDTDLLPTSNPTDNPGNGQLGSCLVQWPLQTGSTVHDTIGPGEAGCCRQVAALHSDHYRQVLLYMILMD